jgi:hypothetical protein
MTLLNGIIFRSCETAAPRLGVRPVLIRRRVGIDQPINLLVASAATREKRLDRSRPPAYQGNFDARQRNSLGIPDAALATNSIE